MAAPRRIGEQMPINAFPHFIGHMQTDSLGQVITHPPAGLDVVFGGGLKRFARQPQSFPCGLRIGGAFTTGSPIPPAPCRGATLQRPPQPKHRSPLPLQTLANTCVADVEFQADRRHWPVVGEVRRLRLATPPHDHVTADHSRNISWRSCHDNHETITHRQRRRAAPIPKLAGAHRTDRRSVRTIYLLARQQRHYRTHRQIRPASSTSAPGSKTGKSPDNTAAAARSSTTASTPSPDLEAQDPQTITGQPLTVIVISASSSRARRRSGRRWRSWSAPSSPCPACRRRPPRPPRRRVRRTPGTYGRRPRRCARCRRPAARRGTES